MKTAHFFPGAVPNCFTRGIGKLGPRRGKQLEAMRRIRGKCAKSSGACAPPSFLNLRCYTVTLLNGFSVKTKIFHADSMAPCTQNAQNAQLAGFVVLFANQTIVIFSMSTPWPAMILCKMCVRINFRLTVTWIVNLYDYLCYNSHISLISCKIGFSLINHPAIGVPPFMENTWNKTWFRYFWVWCSRFLRRGKSHWLSVWFGHQKDPLNGTRAAMWWETCHGGMMIGTCSKHFPEKKAVSNCYENSGELSIKNMLGLSIPNANFLMPCIMQNENYRSIKW